MIILCKKKKTLQETHGRYRSPENSAPRFVNLENEQPRSISTLIDAGLLRESEDGGFELGRAAKLANDGSLAAQFQAMFVLTPT